MKYPESESNVLEFKSELPSNDQIVKTIIGFCNQFGGRLIIGVSDEREVLGLNPDDIPDLTDRISDCIYKSTTPPIVPLIYTQSLGGQILLVIEVSRGMQCPYFITSKGAQKGTYIRLGASTVRAKEDMLFDLQWQARGRTVDETPVYHADLSVLKHQDIIRCLSKRFTSQSKLNVTQLKALGLLIGV
jgi:ATP-dependent DNA helicase RecG